MWAINLYCATFVLQVIFNVLVGSLYEDLGEDPRSWTHKIFNLTRKLVWSIHANFPPTLIGLFTALVTKIPH